MNSNGPPKASNLILLKLGSSPFIVSLTKVPASTHIGSKISKIGLSLLESSIITCISRVTWPSLNHSSPTFLHSTTLNAKLYSPSEPGAFHTTSPTIESRVKVGGPNPPSLPSLYSV